MTHLGFWSPRANKYTTGAKYTPPTNLTWGFLDDVEDAEVGKVVPLFVKTLMGKTITVEVGDGDTVAGVKKVVEVKEGIPEGWQCFIFGSKQLDDGRRLRDYGIGKGSTLYLLLGLRGGGYVVFPELDADEEEEIDEWELVGGPNESESETPYLTTKRDARHVDGLVDGWITTFAAVYTPWGSSTNLNSFEDWLDKSPPC